MGDHVLDDPGEFYEAPAQATAKRVAVIGSGPAGLSAAHYLQAGRARGHRLRAHARGGRPARLRDPALPPAPGGPRASRSRPSRTRASSSSSAPRSTRPSSRSSRRPSTRCSSPPAPGRRPTAGIAGEECLISGTDFLRSAYEKPQDVAGKTIGVIGGGNTAIDVARSLLRLGAKPVIYYRRTKDEMPALDEEIEKAEQEGVRFEFLTQPVGAGEKAGGVDLTCCRMELGDLDESGRPRPVRVEGSEYAVRCDAVIKAIVERPDYSFLPAGVRRRAGQAQDRQGQLRSGQGRLRRRRLRHRTGDGRGGDERRARRGPVHRELPAGQGAGGGVRAGLHLGETFDGSCLAAEHPGRGAGALAGREAEEPRPSRRPALWTWLRSRPRPTAASTAAAWRSARPTWRRR